MFPSHVELAEGILHHAGRAQDDLIERSIRALGLFANLVVANAVFSRAETWDDLIAIAVKFRRHDDAVDFGFSDRHLAGQIGRHWPKEQGGKDKRARRAGWARRGGFRRLNNEWVHKN